MNHPKIIHILADYSVKAIEHTIYNAVLYSKLYQPTIVNSNQEFVFGEIISPGIFLKLVSKDFVPDTLHVCNLHIEFKLPERYLLALVHDQYYLAPDNGMMQIAFGGEDVTYFELPEPEPGDDIFKKIYLPVIEKWHQPDFNAGALFTQTEPRKNAFAPVPTLSGNSLRLTVLYNDSEGNAYLNINQQEFEKVTEGHGFNIRLGFKDNITHISPGYASVPEGQKLALFGLSGLLQVAINSGSAAQYLALEKGKIVVVEIK